MATRAMRLHNYAHIATFKVAAGQTATRGHFVEFAAADDEVQSDGGDATDTLIGVAMEDAAAAAPVDVMLPGPVIPCKAGGTVTRGFKQKSATGGKVTDATTHDSDGAGNESTYGIAMQSGVDGDLVGVCLDFGNRGV